MKKILLSSFVAGLLAGCSVNGGYDSASATENWNRYHPETLSSITLKEKQSLVVLYRDDTIPGGAINVYVNGDYQASLLRNSFSPLALCAQQSLFSTSPVRTQQFGNRIEGGHYHLDAGKTHYFKLVSSANGVVFEPVAAETAKQELAGLNGEIRHTLPRTNAACDVSHR